MKRKIKVYLDTSVISALFDETNPERRLFTRSFFHEIRNFEPYISDTVLIEIDRTPDSALRNRMKKLVSQLPSLPLTDDAEWLANEYVRRGAIPKGYPEDAYHMPLPHSMNWIAL